MKLQIYCILAWIILINGQMIQRSVEGEASYANFTCPSSQNIRPCQCSVVPIIPTIQCAGIRSLKTIQSALRGWARDGPIPYLKIVDARFVGLPSRAFVPVNVSRLEIKDSNLQWVAADAFAGLQSLMVLILHNVKLITFPSESLSQLSSLVTLRLPCNRLSLVAHYHLQSVSKLQFLSLSENRLTFVERGSFPISLVTLSLSKNFLTTLNKSIRSLVNLETVYLDENRLIDLEGELDGLFSLKYLTLGNNMISKLGVSLRYLDNLEYLELQYNSIHKIGTSFKNLKLLKNLNLSMNRLVYLNYHDFENLTSLKHLDLSGNSLKSISGAFDNLLNLETLDLSRNLLKNISFVDIKDLTKLKVLDVSENKLHYLISDLSTGTLPTERLFFAKNEINSLGKFLRHFVCLEGVDLSFNKIRILKIIDFTISSNMEYLGISGNPLICDEEQLTVYRDLRNNKIDVDGEPNCDIDVMHV